MLFCWIFKKHMTRYPITSSYINWTSMVSEARYTSGSTAFHQIDHSQWYFKVLDLKRLLWHLEYQKAISWDLYCLLYSGLSRASTGPGAINKTGPCAGVAAQGQEKASAALKFFSENRLETRAPGIYPSYSPLLSTVLAIFINDLPSVVVSKVRCLRMTA